MNTRIILSSDKDNWNEVVFRSVNYDFYHCNSYYQLDDTTEQAFLFVIEDNENFIAIPLVKRIIETTDYFDCTSAYGYPGPISNCNTDEISSDLIIEFQKQFISYCFNNKIVTVFSRLHPIFDQTPILKGIGAIVSLNATIAIDLNLEPKEQTQQYRKSNKSEISQLNRKGFTVRKATNSEQLLEFINIYNATMERLNAADSYFFSQAYFEKMLQTEDYTCNLLLAYYNEEIAAGAIFNCSNRIMQYHLAATKEAYYKYAPMKLVIDTARIIGNSYNMRYLHLGGGVNGSNDDSLYKFKAGFSNTIFNYSIWKMVIDEEIYNKLTQERQKIAEVKANYFPLYRA